MQKINVDVSTLSTQVQRNTDSNRIETGVVQFNDDWPGVFIRGDNAMHFATRLKQLIAMVEKPGTQTLDMFTLISAKNLVDLLESCAILNSETENKE